MDLQMKFASPHFLNGCEFVNNHQQYGNGHVDDENIFAFNIPSSTRAFQYSRVKAYGNH